MKNLLKGLLLMPSILFIMESCFKSNTQPSAPVAPTGSTSSQIDLSGNWKVSSFAQRTEDKTSMFKGFVFTFDTTGSVTANGNGTSTTGTWAFANKPVSYYGSTPSKSSFTMNFAAINPFTNLTKTWDVDSVHTNASTLALVSPEVVEQMHVTFSKQ